jgi:hypothetical protein
MKNHAERLDQLKNYFRPTFWWIQSIKLFLFEYLNVPLKQPIYSPSK